ncbi:MULTISPECIES: glycoside hydrolase family 43 protein [unclassified Sphingomonas]|uniref:glycoside hydrolase family 43 protein n=1 Tax=unclassified Sphingomonas TaxID=196159 RepID=UPI002269D19A|nr:MULTISPECIES: glycoside hydrolase family 43 protein [unclassified Sphingomonas]
MRASRGVALLLGAVILSCSAAISAGPGQPAASFRNPLLPSGADPWIVRDGADYYHMHTTGDGLEIWKTRDVTDLAHAEHHVIWRPHSPAPNGLSIWAPELHRIEGRWYIYYTAAETGHDDDAHRGIFVLENAAADPTTGTWIDRGRLATAHHGIDGTTFAYRGQRYFVYSPYVGDESDLAIVAMSDPVTLTGPETIIARPDRDWEKQGGRQILEGPEFLLGPKGDLFLSYSASACWSDGYALGLLHAAPGSDPRAAAAWVKSATPVLATSEATQVFAPGHNAFFTAPSGKTWIVYHANARSGMKCSSQRSPRIQPVGWSRDGMPVIGPPVAAGVALPKPH